MGSVFLEDITLYSPRFIKSWIYSIILMHWLLNMHYSNFYIKQLNIASRGSELCITPHI